MTTEHRNEITNPQQPSNQTLPDEESAIMGTIASFMPWVISLFFHAGILVILAFITIVLLRPVGPVKADDTTVNVLDENWKEITPVQGEIRIETDRERLPRRADWRKSDETIPIPQDRERTFDIRGMEDWPDRNNDKTKGDDDDDDDDDDDGPPEIEIIGSKGNAWHVVYLMDCSGSMLDAFGGVRAELIRSISKLGCQPKKRLLDRRRVQPEVKRPKPTFHVIFFSTGKLRENPPRRLVYATDANKRAAIKYLKTITPENRTDPIPALKRAFAVLNRAPNDKKEKLIILLTDGEFPDNQKVFRVINTLNAGRNVHINTILHRHHSPDAVKVLRRIAKENAGTFKFVEAGE